MGIYRKLLKHISPIVLGLGIGMASSACSEEGDLSHACSYKMGIEEICNNKDDNCDGTIDEGCDADDDGYCASGKRFEPMNLSAEWTITPEGTTGGTTEEGELPYFLQEGFTCRDSFARCITALDQGSSYCPPMLTDCNDSNPLIHPGAIDICNGIDDDCKNGIDDSFPQRGRECYVDLEGRIFSAEEAASSDGKLCGPSEYSCYLGELRCSADYGEEVCDNKDNDCDGITDNNGAENEMERGCYYQWQTDESGVLRKVDGLEDPEQYGIPGVGICKEGFELCTIDCYDPAIPEPVQLECREDLPAGEEGACCQEGVIGGNQVCYDTLFAQTEICNCIDDNCNGTADEGLHTEYLQDFAIVTDCSGSMSAELGPVRTAFTSVHFPECFDEEAIRVSSIFVGDPATSEPLMTRSLVTGGVFAANFGTDLESIPAGSCSSEENVLQAAAYSACAVVEMEGNNLCERIEGERIHLIGTPLGTLDIKAMDYFLIGKENLTSVLSVLPAGFASWNQEERDNYLSLHRREMWRGGSEKHLVLITDEKAQTRYGYLNQQIVGDLLREANIMVDLYILPQHFNFLNLDEGYGEQGYGYLVCQEQGDDGSCVNPNGNAYNLDEEISAGRLGRSIRQGFIDYYCNEGETGSILEREEE